MKQRQKGIISFTVKAGVVARVPSHFTARRSRSTGQHGWASSRKWGDWSIDSRGSHCSLLRDASHPEADLIGFALLPNAVIRDVLDEPSSSNTMAVENTENDENRREETGREDCEASRRWSALDLASVRSLAGPSCSPVLICFLLPSRRPSRVSLRRSLPRPSPPRSRKGGFESPPVLAAASCCRCNEKPERRRMRTLLITLVVLYAPEENPLPLSASSTNVGNKRESHQKINRQPELLRYSELLWLCFSRPWPSSTSTITEHAKYLSSFLISYRRLIYKR